MFCHRFTCAKQAEHDIWDSLFGRLSLSAGKTYEEILNDCFEIQPLTLGENLCRAIDFGIYGYLHDACYFCAKLRTIIRIGK